MIPIEKIERFYKTKQFYNSMKLFQNKNKNILPVFSIFLLKINWKIEKNKNSTNVRSHKCFNCFWFKGNKSTKKK